MQLISILHVGHKSYFVDESVAFRHGMAGIYYIENKAMVADVVIPVDRGDFPLSSFDLLLFAQMKIARLNKIGDPPLS